MKCTDCAHFEVCCYVDPNLPACDTFLDKNKIIPYSVGDTSYAIAYSTPIIIQVRIFQIQIVDHNTYIWIENIEDTIDFWKLPVDEYNEWANFPTKEEAEKKLEELK